MHSQPCEFKHVYVLGWIELSYVGQFPSVAVTYPLHPKSTGVPSTDSTCNLSQSSFSTNTPPSVVLLWIHMVTGEAPTSLLQETLTLYHVMACSPGTSHWRGGTVTLMNLVVITSPSLRLTSLTLDGTKRAWGSIGRHLATALGRCGAYPDVAFR